jgi:hypothetical protein
MTDENYFRSLASHAAATKKAGDKPAFSVTIVNRFQ